MRKHRFSRLVLCSTSYLWLLSSTVTFAEQPAAPKMDLSGTWIETPYGQPVIDRGNQGSWDHAAVDNPYVYTERGRHYCFYEAQDQHGSGWHERIGVAVSENGQLWKKTPENPILNVGPPGAWDAVVAKLPAGVLWHDQQYYLFYSGRNHNEMQKSDKCIGVATASDLIGPWQKSARNPILRSRSHDWDKRLSTLPSPVFCRDGEFFLLFRGMQGFYYEQGVGIATSRNLLQWQRLEAAQEQPLIPSSEEIASFAVARTDGGYTAISQPLQLNQRAYWRSPDLIHWSKAGAVKQHVSHAAETISNPFFAAGQWHILYEQKDRIYHAVLLPTKDP